MLQPRSRKPFALVASLVGVVALTIGASSAAPGPEEIGAWTAPFEEGGSAAPRCAEVGGRLVCKPTAVGSAALKDGSVLYMNGVEGNDNQSYQYVTELGNRGADSLSRVLNLRSGTPTWDIPNPQDGGGSNPLIKPGLSGLENDPFGYLGVPGKPGDGLVGSLWGAAGLPPQQSAAPPDDPADNDGDLFCTDQAQLADGRLLIVGGSDMYNEPAVLDTNNGDPYDVGVLEIEGLRNARIYDPATRSYTQVEHMSFGRWYPSMVTMADGKVLTIGGVTKLIKPTQGSQVRRNETFDPKTGHWTVNYAGLASEASLPLFPRVYLMPNGKVLYTGAGQTFGPEGEAHDELLWALRQFWNPTTDEWEIIGPAPLGVRGGATVVPLAMDPPYDKQSLLTFGGTLGPTPGSLLALPLSAITTVDKNGNISDEMTGTLVNRRWFSSGVALPDGSVLAFSGADRDEVIPWSGSELPVRQAELFDPATKTWKAMAESSRDRTYHNSALLLPDGRVLVGGHAPIGSAYGANHDLVPGVTANNDRDPSFEVFSPPYLFKGARPSIAQVQRGIKWGTTFTIASNDAGSVDQVVLSRLPSPQHTVDTDTRTLRLAFTKASGLLTAAAPPNGLAAPPGYYYLFILRNGVPSVARIVQVGDTTDLAATTPLYASANPPPPSTSMGASEDPDSSYLNKPPPLPLGIGVVGLGFAGAGAATIPARRRRQEDAA